MFGLGKVEELVIILIIILVLFGAKKLPELSRGIAESIKEVRKGFREDPSAATAAKSSSDNKPNAS
jgi:sec-independent protein translocase protein TatA